MFLIKSCSCKNEYQDKRYGNGVRLHNVNQQKKKEAERGTSCTSCGFGARPRQADWKKYRHRA